MKAARREPARVLLRLLIARLGLFLATLAGAAWLVLALLWLAPGDAIDVLPDGEALRPALAADWGLDQGLGERWLRLLGGAATGDLGVSTTVRPGAPVWGVIARPAARSAAWVVAAIALASVWGALLAYLTRGRRGLSRALIQGVSVAPVFLLAHLAVASLNAAAWSLMQADWILRPSWFALPDQDSPFRSALAVVVLAVGSGLLADVHREAEVSLGALRRSGHVEAARARGAPLWPHLLPGLALALAQVAASRAGLVVGGLVILERVLLLQGGGALLWQAALMRDLPVAVALTLAAAAFVALARFGADALRILIDPRARAEVTP